MTYDQDDLDFSPGHELDERPADPFAIEALLLPSGGKVEFRSMARITGANVQWLRGVDDREGQMIMYNELLKRALTLLVDSWDLTTETGRPIPVPRDSKDGAWLKLIGAFDMTAIERHLREPINRLTGDDIGGGEGE